MKKFVLLSLLCFVLTTLDAQEAVETVTTGPEKGTLMVIGGGNLSEDIMARFKALAGGDSARIVVIPTALDDDFFKQDSVDDILRNYFRGFDIEDIQILHTRDSARANEADFAKPLQKATGVFFVGGRQWRLADSYLHTRVHDELFRLLAREGVIAGTSAGATIQGSYLARGDTQNNQIMMGDHEEGLAFISNMAIDQHVLARNRQFDLFNILQQRPELLGIGIDENTAIVVQADTFEVIGASYVLVYDQKFWSREGSELKSLPPKNELFYFLRAGDRYNMRERKVIVP